MTDPRRHAVPLDATLHLTTDKQVGIRWPLAVSEKLDALLESARAAGERTDRKELLAALVAVCDLDGPSLGNVLRTYRTMKVRDVLPAQPEESTVAHLADHKPGPRRAVK